MDPKYSAALKDLILGIHLKDLTRKKLSDWFLSEALSDEFIAYGKGKDNKLKPSDIKNATHELKGAISIFSSEIHKAERNKKVADNPVLLRKKEVMQILNVSDDTVDNYVRKKYFKNYGMKNAPRYDKNEVLEFKANK